jgi:hypothetical protein
MLLTAAVRGLSRSNGSSLHCQVSRRTGGGRDGLLQDMTSAVREKILSNLSIRSQRTLV